MHDVSNGTKPCLACNKVKPLSDFRKDSRSRTGVRSHCKDCTASEDKKYRKSDAGKQRISARKQTAEYKIKQKRHAKEYAKNETPDQKAKRLAANARWRNKTRSISNKGVYLVHMNGIYKIGKSNYVAQRIASLQWTMPYPVELVHVIPSENPLAGEQELHKRFAHCRMMGEWFALSPDEVTWIMSLMQI